MAEQKLGIQTWHCTSHVALFLYSTSKARSYCCFTLSAHNRSGVRIPTSPHTNKIKRGSAVSRSQVRYHSKNRTEPCALLVTNFMMHMLSILVWKRKYVKPVSAAHWNITISGVCNHLNYFFIFIVLQPVCWKPMW